MSEINDIMTFFASIMTMPFPRMRHTNELLLAVQSAVVAIEMRFKDAMACRRPSEFSPQDQPLIVTPGHSSLPSGHATESFAVATVMRALAIHRESAQATAGGASGPSATHTEIQLMRQAYRIAVNRTVAGVHFPVDSAAGAYLGMALGRYFVQRFQKASDAPEVVDWTVDSYVFNGPAYSSTAMPGVSPDFIPALAEATLESGGASETNAENPAYVREDNPIQITGTGSAELGLLWKNALDEWR
ncbi:phosphatase PAP2 family protein [uncultured Shimia sp.]|uniref:phosphatase PAP2 family protein n=1 Tax=uncultured Shimia sp. TaxID=573152 RepID=UPI00260A29C5|nr:phosphatase PAP2 family protein [uncultured Shimia sp.]